MTDNIIQIEKPEPLIYVCECGCSSFGLLSDGSTECQNCGTVDAEWHGGWENHDPVLRGKDASASFTDTTGNGSVDFARARMSRIASDDDCTLIVIAKDDSTVHVWPKAEEQQQLARASKQMDVAMNLLRRSCNG